MGCYFVGWCALGVEGQAAWVQAVGSVVAIAVAVWLPARERSHARKGEVQAKARRMHVDRKLLSSTLEQLIAVSNQLAAGYRIPLEPGIPELEAIENKLWQGNLYDPGLSGFKQQLPEFGDQVIDAVIAVIREIDQYQALHSNLWQTDKQVKVRRWHESVSSLILRLDTICSAASKANMLVRRDDDMARKDRGLLP